jgi:hypothetical protein
MIHSEKEAEQYIKNNLDKVINFYSLDADLNNLQILMQIERSSAEHKAWSFTILDIEVPQAIFWVSDTGDFFATNSKFSEYSVQIENWLEIAAKNNDFFSTAEQSRSFLTQKQSAESADKDSALNSNKSTTLVSGKCTVCGIDISQDAYSPRYPMHACQNCAKRAGDHEGRKVTYSNTHISGGLIATYEDNGIPYIKGDGTYNEACYIDGIPFKAQEAYMGGVVLLPNVQN